jgi:hypothetical protein
MAFGTLTTGTVRCDWCGRYLKNTNNGFLSSVGLGGIAKVASAASKHYCGEECRRAAEAAAGQAAEAKVSAAAAEAEVEKARIEAREREDAAFEEKVKEGHNAVTAVTFGEDASSIANGLSTLLALVNQYDPKTKFGFASQNALKGVRQSAFEKIEMGIMLLRNKDAAQADYFQSKFEEKKGTLTGKINAAKNMGKTLGGLFGKK